MLCVVTDGQHGGPGSMARNPWTQRGAASRQFLRATVCSGHAAWNPVLGPVGVQDCFLFVVVEPLGDGQHWLARVDAISLG